jgi:hypothetical protein
MYGLGTIINTAAIVVGGILGLLFGKLIKARHQDSLGKACGIAVLFIGIAGALEGIMSLADDGSLVSGHSLLVVVCLTLGAGNTILFILGLFAFNFSMPITLYLANILLKGKEGFAFGSLAAILAPGYFLAMSFSYSLPMRIFIALLCLASMILIIIISRKVSAYDRTVASNDNP